MGDSTLAIDAWEALFRAQVTIMRRLTAEFPNDEISLSDYDVLFTLSQAPDRRLRIKSLGENMLLTQPSVSRLIDRLVARGLVTKTPDADDRRGIIVALTDTGYDAFRRAAVQHSRSIVDNLDGVLTEDEMYTLIELCGKLKSAVK
ncbi:MAG TPA: MarR family transcriptional regulator [Terrimesophilobacter sp.]|nr:MarR family transcriptional regulator [Terrimesophilobacter sp.]HRQ00135.1 MarR family transcriptional regulator [Terrimesophilobacter sp.]